MLFTLIYIFIGSISFSMDRSHIKTSGVTYTKSSNWSGRFIGLDASKSFVNTSFFHRNFLVFTKDLDKVLIEMASLKEEEEVSSQIMIFGKLLLSDYVFPVSGIDLGLVLRDNLVFGNDFMFSVEYRWNSVVSTIGHISNFLGLSFSRIFGGSNMIDAMVEKISDQLDGISEQIDEYSSLISWFFYPTFIFINAIPEFRFKFPILLEDKVRFVPGFFVSNVINLGINFAYEFMLSQNAFLNVELGATVLDGLNMVLTSISSVKSFIGREGAPIFASSLFTSCYFLVGFNFRI